MPDVVTFDPINLRIIEIGTGGDNEIDWLEIYSEWKDWLLADATRLGYPQAFRVVGGDPISGTASLGSTFFLLSPWKFRPAEYSHRLRLVGNTYSDPAGEPVVVPTLGAFTVLVESEVSNLVDATFVNAPEIQQVSFDGTVVVDAASSFSGTDYPTGTRTTPVNNLTDAKAIAVSRGFNTFRVISNLTVSSIDLSNFSFIADNPKITVTVDASANVSNCNFENLSLEGTLTGITYVTNCFISNVTNIHGHLTYCTLLGNITLSGAGALSITKCVDGIEGFGAPLVDLAGTGSALLVMGYRGGITLRNKTGTESVSINLDTGRVVLENTITNGTIIVRGIGTMDDSTVGATVSADGLTNPAIVSDTVWDELLAQHGTAGSAGVIITQASLKAALAAALSAAK